MLDSLFARKPEPSTDGPRLGKQLAAVHRHMLDGYQEWWTFAQLRAALLADGIGISEAAVSARIRDLRKREYGGYTVDRMATDRRGIFAYRARR